MFFFQRLKNLWQLSKFEVILVDNKLEIKNQLPGIFMSKRNATIISADNPLDEVEI